MTATQESLFPPGWDVEPDADERAHVDVHGPQRRPRTGSPWARHWGPMWDYGRSAARPDVVCGRRIHTLTVPGRWL